MDSVRSPSAPVSSSSDTLALIGRVLLSFIFIASGYSKIVGWDQTIAYMTSKGVPLAPVALGIATAIEILCGLAVFLGIKTRAAALVLFLYLIPVTLIFHNFWALAGAERQFQSINFLKNLSILGGLLGVVANGPGALSVDLTRPKRQPETEAAKAAKAEGRRLRRIS